MEETVKPLRLVIAGAGNQIAYFILRYLLNGEIYGKNQPIVLSLLETSRNLHVIREYVNELDDMGFLLLEELVITADPATAYRNAQIVFFIMTKENFSNEELRVDYLRGFFKMCKRHAQILNEHADRRVKVIVCSPPVNTCCLIISRYAPDILKKNITGVIRLDLNRAKAQLAAQLGVPCNNIKRCVIWGTKSSTTGACGFIDVSYAKVILPDGKETTIYNALKNDSWLKNDFISIMKSRSIDPNFTGPGCISYFMSVAKAIMDHAYEWWIGTEDWTSMIVYNPGKYDAPKDLFFSFPVTIKKGRIYIVDNLETDEFLRSKIESTGKELEAEKNMALTECG